MKNKQKILAYLFLIIGFFSLRNVEASFRAENKVCEFKKCILNNNTEKIKYYLDNKIVDINVVINQTFGITAIMLAIMMQSQNMISLLLEYKANLKIRDAKGFDSLNHAMFTENQQIINLIQTNYSVISKF